MQLSLTFSVLSISDPCVCAVLYCNTLCSWPFQVKPQFQEILRLSEENVGKIQTYTYNTQKNPVFFFLFFFRLPSCDCWKVELSYCHCWCKQVICSQLWTSPSFFLNSGHVSEFIEASLSKPSAEWFTGGIVTLLWNVFCIESHFGFG